MEPLGQYDVVVVGAGHAGIEAALAAARMGASTTLVTMNIDTVGRMSCNPAIGGLAKGTLVREVDALGGEMGVAADRFGIQFRMLNTGRGPAVRSPRAQEDRVQYSIAMRRALESQTGLDVLQEDVTGLIIEDGECRGVIAGKGARILGRSVVIAAGTFLDAEIHVGEERRPAGRAGEPPSRGLSDALRAAGLRTARLKTGTPPRVNALTVDLGSLERQDGDEHPSPFSFMTGSIDGSAQVPCHITWTGRETHDIIRANLHRAPLFSGQITATGPRYCPSLETKVVRFPDKDSHQVFLEPEGRGTTELYCNGISTSLPRDVQDALVRSLPGMARARIVRYGYAIEYDYVPPLGQLTAGLMCRSLPGLFLAGQVNGTSGYEEAAAQGLIAGINAVLRARGSGPLILGRHEAYIGVMIDDLVTTGLTEPYRMFTSRAEHRLLLRQDNADRRLTRIGAGVGLASASRIRALDEHEQEIGRGLAALRAVRCGAKTALDLLRRPELTIASLTEAEPALDGLNLAPRAAEQIEIEAKYEGYIERQRLNIEKQLRSEETRIPPAVDFRTVHGLSAEAVEKLSTARPFTLGQAGRVEGVTPADVAVLSVHIRRISAAPA